MILSPSILAADFGRLGEQIKEADRAGADYIHIDVMDGLFVPNRTDGIKMFKENKRLETKPFDVHLMVKDIKKYVNRYV